MSNLTHRWPFGLNRKTWPDRVAVIILVLFLLVFVDAFVSQSLQQWSDVWRAPFFFITDFGLSDWVLIPSLLLLILSALALRLSPGRYRPVARELTMLSGFVFIGVGLPGLIANLIKRVIGRGRPEYYDQFGAFDFQHVLNDYSFQSFPSGHATTALGTALVIGFMAPRFFRLLLLIAVMTGFSRIVIGMHYPTDVLAGFVLGGLGAYAVRNAFASRNWLFSARSDGTVRFRGVPRLRRLLRRRA